MDENSYKNEKKLVVQDELEEDTNLANDDDSDDDVEDYTVRRGAATGEE